MSAVTVSLGSTLVSGAISKKLNSNGLLTFGIAKGTNYRVYELVAFAVVGVLGTYPSI